MNEIRGMTKSYHSWGRESRKEWCHSLQRCPKIFPKYAHNKKKLLPTFLTSWNVTFGPTAHFIALPHSSWILIGISIEIEWKFKLKIVEADSLKKTDISSFFFYCSLWSWCLPIYPIWKDSRRPILCWRCTKKTISLYNLSLCLLFQTCYGPTRLQPTYQMHQWTSSS